MLCGYFLIFLGGTNNNFVKAVDFPRVGETCTIDSDCFDDFEVCKADLEVIKLGEEEIGICEHKEVWPMNTLEWIGNFAVIIVLLTSNCGGLGGGGAVIPVAMLFYGFDSR